MANGTKTEPWIKDPDAILDYDVDWTKWLGADTLATSAFAIVTAATVPALVIDSNSNTTTVSKVWLSGGKSGTKYELRNRITTAGGRTNDRTVYVKVKET